jgi:hypothetical protein
MTAVNREHTNWSVCLSMLEADRRDPATTPRQPRHVWLASLPEPYNVRLVGAGKHRDANPSLPGVTVKRRPCAAWEK